MVCSVPKTCYFCWTTDPETPRPIGAGFFFVFIFSPPSILLVSLCQPPKSILGPSDRPRGKLRAPMGAALRIDSGASPLFGCPPHSGSPPTADFRPFFDRQLESNFTRPALKPISHDLMKKDQKMTNPKNCSGFFSSEKLNRCPVCDRPFSVVRYSEHSVDVEVDLETGHRREYNRPCAGPEKPFYRYSHTLN